MLYAVMRMHVRQIASSKPDASFSATRLNHEHDWTKRHRRTWAQPIRFL